MNIDVSIKKKLKNLRGVHYKFLSFVDTTAGKGQLREEIDEKVLTNFVETA